MKKHKKTQTKKIAKPTHTTFKIRPLGDRIIIRETLESKEQTTASGIIIPISVQEDKGSKSGKVVAVGTGRMEDGKLVPLTVSVGDSVLFQWGDKVKVDNEDYYIVRESEILALIN